MSELDRWYAPVPQGDGLATRTALVAHTDPRAAVATTLVLQEMRFTVDLGSEPGYALRWLRRASYDVIVAGGAEVGTVEFASKLRGAAAKSRVLLMAEATMPPGSVRELGVEVLRPPVDVNARVGCFLPVT